LFQRKLTYLDSIKAKREEALFESYALIEQTLKRYQKSEVLCPRTDKAYYRLSCDAMLLGALLKSAATKKIYPVPHAPYGEVSFNELVEKLKSLHVEALCDGIARCQINGAYPKQGHGLMEAIRQKITSLEQRLSGLDIEEFKEKKQV
jgi:hypothetical protein